MLENPDLPLDKVTNAKIFNFDNVQFLRIYQEIVTTDEGQYFRLKTTDIDLNPVKNTNRERLKKWSMKGMNVFLVAKAIKFPNPLPQRFAIKLNRQGTCNWLEHRFSFYQ